MTHGGKLLKHATVAGLAVAVSLAAGQALARKPDRQLSLAVWGVRLGHQV